MRVVVILFVVFCGAQGLQENNIFNEQVVEGSFVPQESQRRGLRGFLDCGYEMSCYLDNAENLLVDQRNMLMAEADQEAALTQSGRGSSQSPSSIAGTIQKILSEITSMLRTEFDSFFRDSKEADKTNENGAEEEEDEEEEEEDRTMTEESRGKKKKKLKALIKFLVLGAVIKAKITVLIQLLSAALQVKFFLIALAGLLLNIARLWIDLKKGHHPQKVIYYEHAQHQHHYDHGDDEHGGYWGRAFEVDSPAPEGSAQDLAYGKQKPIPWAP